MSSAESHTRNYVHNLPTRIIGLPPSNSPQNRIADFMGDRSLSFEEIMVLTLALMASATVCIPFTASAEYSGTKYTFEDFNANIYSGGGGVSGPAWSKETDDGTYLRYKTGWNMDINEQSILMSVCKGGTPAWNAGDKVGFTLGKAYDIEIEYRYPASAGGSYDWVNKSVEATLLKDGNVGNYNSAYNQALFTE